MMDKPVSCHLHDYVEIACLYGYKLKLLLKSGETISGKAVTTGTTADKKEYLVLEISWQIKRIQLEQLGKMQALTVNPHFDEIIF